MNRQEFGVIVNVLKSVYTESWFLPNKDTINVWYELISDLPFEVAKVASLKWMQTNDRAPKPSDIRKIAVSLVRQTDTGSEAEAWALVRKAISNGIYNAQSEFDRLPSICKKAVGDPSNLRDWAMLDSESVDSVIQSQFMRTYRTVANQTDTDSVLSDTIRTAIESARSNAKKIDSNSGVVFALYR